MSYLLENQHKGIGCLFTAMCWIVAGTLLPAWLDMPRRLTSSLRFWLLPVFSLSDGDLFKTLTGMSEREIKKFCDLNLKWESVDGKKRFDCLIVTRRYCKRAGSIGRLGDGYQDKRGRRPLLRVCVRA